MTLRTSQTALVFASALFFALVVFNNLTDYGSNAQFVRHVLAMDTTFPGNAGMWRAIASPRVQRLFYFTIIGWELACTALLAGAALRMWSARDLAAGPWQEARRWATAGLTLALLQWSAFFLSVGGEWFLMWQSRTWNGQEAAARMFVVDGLTLAILHLPSS